MNFTPKYHHEECSEAQYLTEIVTERYARSQNKSLQPKFWNNLEWKSFYRQQIIAANALLKLYSLQSIVNALNGKCSWTYSLRANQLKNEIVREEAKLKNRQKEIESKMDAAVTVEDVTKVKPRKKYKKGSRFNVD
jgi:hypothetical protein